MIFQDKFCCSSLDILRVRGPQAAAIFKAGSN